LALNYQITSAKKNLTNRVLETNSNLNTYIKYLY